MIDLVSNVTLLEIKPKTLSKNEFGKIKRIGLD